MQDEIRKRYQRFAEFEARGVSPIYEELAHAVCSQNALTEFISSLPRSKQQPNLVFTAVRHLYGTPESGRHFAALIAKNAEPIRRLILARSTQTNEPGRCSTLVPVLAQLSQPLALIEVGASAGLCLLPDYYGYDYGSRRLAPAERCHLEAPWFPCKASAATPIPSFVPRVVWRRGIDLNPINITDKEQTSWLESLVWPEQTERAARLRAAIEIAREAAPLVLRGDLLTGLSTIAASAPSEATLVIFHSAVLAYLPSREAIDSFVSTVRQLKAVWISNEAPAVLPAVAARAKVTPPPDRFLLAIDGEPVALTGPHGQSIEWLANALQSN
jgi:hypothetical protein